jgi:signal transduction histidine kinase
MDSTTPLNVLLVEDSDLQSRIIESFVRKWSISTAIRRSSTLRDAMIKIIAARPQVILLDVYLPDSEGIDTVRRMVEAARGTPIIVMTARDDETFGEQSLACGAQDFFSKDQINERLLWRAFRYAMQRQNIINTNRQLAEQLQHEQRLLHQAQKLESIGQLAAGIAHEINTPAQYVSDNVGFLRDQFNALLTLVDAAEPTPVLTDLRAKLDYDFLKSEVPSAIAQSLEGLERISHIVRAMKDFSHPGTDHHEQADLNKAIESTVTVCRARWKYLADLTCDFDAKLPPVPCMVAEFNQVMLNLIVNAADAIGERFGQHHHDGKIVVATAREGDWAVIRITDNGNGIPDAIKHRIFDPFFTTKEVGKGTGQGLAISRDVIVNKHGGTIDVASIAGQGTTFTIRLPLTGKSVRSAA